MTLDLTSSVPLAHRWSVDIGDITVTAQDGEIVYCDIGWCLSPAVALLSLYPASAAILIWCVCVRVLQFEAGPDDRVFVMYAGV